MCIRDSFLNGCFKRNPAERLNVLKCLQHPFVAQANIQTTNKEKMTKKKSSESIQSEALSKSNGSLEDRREEVPMLKSEPLPKVTESGIDQRLVGVGLSRYGQRRSSKRETKSKNEGDLFTQPTTELDQIIKEFSKRKTTIKGEFEFECDHLLSEEKKEIFVQSKDNLDIEDM
eukprot:TRINITY_DN8030_c0_g1_i3.p1 TRINITY_DN8030_c0_g1~~TRINITY_DN8030_c0_g1_i3.p1  ORF type:complete len:173 (+),score=48.28 TRINITY_DN8030_c0_g1_i3:63-581(+)